MKTYSEKLKDPRWQKRRLEVLERDNWTCQRCESTENTLHVHHKVYEGSNPWDTNLEYLLTLCSECHGLEELELKEYSKLLIDTFKKSSFSADSMREFAWGIENICVEQPNWKIASAISYALRTPKVMKFIVDEYNKHCTSRRLKNEKELKERELRGEVEPF